MGKNSIGVVCGVVPVSALVQVLPAIGTVAATDTIEGSFPYNGKEEFGLDTKQSVQAASTPELLKD